MKSFEFRGSPIFSETVLAWVKRRRQSGPPALESVPLMLNPPIRMHSHQGSCAFSGDVKITHMKLVLETSCFSSHQQASFLFPDFDMTLNRHSVPSPNMRNPGPTGLFTALPDFCQSMKRKKRTGQRPTKEPEIRMEGHCFGFGTSNFGFPVRG